MSRCVVSEDRSLTNSVFTEQLLQALCNVGMARSRVPQTGDVRSCFLTLASTPNGGSFEVSPENDRASPNVKTP